MRPSSALTYRARQRQLSPTAALLLACSRACRMRLDMDQRDISTDDEHARWLGATMTTRVPTRARPRPGSATRPRKGRSISIKIKRVYEEAAPEDGLRILVDRLWPRGVSKAALKYDAWPRELAPSTELRTWYGHDPKRFTEFRRRYRKELSAQREAVAALRATIKGRAATLITAVRELNLSHAVVLRELLLEARRRS